MTCKSVGLTSIPKLNHALFDFQSDIVAWALRKGRAAIFADCGLGKTLMQLEWAVHIPGRVLILAPLAVAQQTIREGDKFGIKVHYARRHKDTHTDTHITITNYEMLDHFDPSQFSGIVLDESSILKAYNGKTRTKIIDAFRGTPYRLCCTATPAPNDFMEIGNHAEFLDVLTRSEMLSTFFVHDGGETQKWRLKGHAQSEFWRWMCGWAVMIRKPSDLGYDDGGFTLPPIHFHEIVVRAQSRGDFLFPMPASTLKERQLARRDTIDARTVAAAGLLNGDNSPWLFWCNLNAESRSLAKAINGAVEITGSHSLQCKTDSMMGFSSGAIKRLVTKPSISGFGMNWQHCNNVVFVGLNDSYEQFYQATRRCWRFGQERPVNVYIVVSDIEGSVVSNIKRKERDAALMAEMMVENMADLNRADLRRTTHTKDTYKTDSQKGNRWELRLGDCVEECRSITSESIDYTIFSPPFASLYTYGASSRDMGNCRDDVEFMQHFKFLLGDLYRVTSPGRLMSFHCMNLPTSKTHHGYIGIRDFRGELIRTCEDAGWIYHSEVVIWKDPVIAMQRTKALGLLHKQVVKDSCMSRQGIPDYLVTMRKPGLNDSPVAGPLDHFIGDKSTFQRTGNLSIDIWQRYASPVWADINPSRTLQARVAREHKDERHICPLQLDVIERCLQLWTNTGDLVLSPFAGIGSEGYCAIKMDRRFIGVELKESYWRTAITNIGLAEEELSQTRLL
jgi:hypothetical protein